MIRNVLICGIGAIGSIYADKIQKHKNSNLKILTDKYRFERYIRNPIILNGKELVLDYILPEETGYKADLIIIATKYDGLSESIRNIQNFVKDDTIILSLLNGVTSESLIAEKYGWDNVLLSYFIGHSAVRQGRCVTQDGIGRIVFGSKFPEDKKVLTVKEFFNSANIDYEIPEDMEYSLWLKYMLNVSSNQPSAILNMTFGQMQNNKKFLEFFINLMKEVQQIAKAEGIKNTENMIADAIKVFNKMTPDGKTSMLQDVLAKRKTEVDMFAGDMIRFGEKHNISVPYNKMMYELINIIHDNY